MINFHPKLEDSTNEKLKDLIQTSDPKFGLLPSNELLKRSLNKLEKTIQVLSKESSKQTTKMLFLTYSIFFLTAIMVVGLVIQIILSL